MAKRPPAKHIMTIRSPLLNRPDLPDERDGDERYGDE